MSSDSELLSLKKKRKKGMNILGGRGTLHKFLTSFQFLRKSATYLGEGVCSAFVSVTAQLFEKVPVSFFGWSLNLKIFVVAHHMNTQLWYRKGYKIPKKNWDTLLCIALVSVTAQLFAPTTAHHPQA